MTEYNLGHVVGNGIESIELLSTIGLVKTYRITFTDGSTFDFEVTDGSDGQSANIVTSWSSPLSDTAVPSEKLVKNTVDGKANENHASTGTTYGVGTGSNYGHCRVVNNLTTNSYSDGQVLSAYQGKVLQDQINDLEDSIDGIEEDMLQ